MWQEVQAGLPGGGGGGGEPARPRRYQIHLPQGHSRKKHEISSKKER
jgi:hypothetical protein